jgi:mono/diheme cytochrome c family protein
MKRISIRALFSFSLTLLVALAPLAARAQSPADAKQIQGMRLFNQSCRVCHVKAGPEAADYAPALSKSTLNGDEAAMRAFIANGSPRMPGFKTHFKRTEIEAIAAYLKTFD